MSLKRWCILAALLTLAWTARTQTPTATLKTKVKASLLDLHLQGTIVNRTANHGVDRRIWSRNLYQHRDLYVYLPRATIRTSPTPS